MSNDNSITGLRDVLFDTLRALKDGNLDIERAKAVNETAQTIINSAKVEVDYMKVSGAAGESQFLLKAMVGGMPPDQTQTKNGTKSVEHLGSGVTVTRHRMRK